MINIIKADLFRIFNLKVYKETLIASLVVLIITVVFINFKVGSISLLSFFDSSYVKREFLISYIYEGGFNAALKSSFSTIFFMIIISVILTSKVISDKLKSGIYKTTVPYGYKRYKIYIGNLIAIMISMSFILISVFLVSFIITKILYFDEIIITSKGITLIIVSLCTYLIGVFSIISLYSLITLICKSTWFTICIFIIFTFITTVLGSIIPINIQNFMIVPLLRLVASENSFEFFYIGIKNGLIIGLVFITLGVFIFNKEEIR